MKIELIKPYTNPYYDAHYAIYKFYNAPIKGFISIHRNYSSLPSFGATRVVHSISERSALNDVLKLSKSMSYKSLVSGLKYGGAKAIIISNNTISESTLAKSYSEVLKALNFNFVTGADMGLNNNTLSLIEKKYPYIVGLKYDPLFWTVEGLVKSIETISQNILKKDYKKCTFLIQGLGKIGKILLEKLIEGGIKTIAIADVNKKLINEIKNKYPFVISVNPNNIYDQEADIFCPCASGGIINEKNALKMRFKAIIGGANNQLNTEKTSDILYNRGIFYAPDYLVNAGGLIAVAIEYEEKFSKLSSSENHTILINKKLISLQKLLKDCIKQSYQKKKPVLHILNDYVKKLEQSASKNKNK